MIGLVLLLTAASIALTNGTPIEVSSPYLEYPEDYKENYKNLNYFNLPKTSYQLRPQLQSDSKRNGKKPISYTDIMDKQNDDVPRRSDSSTNKATYAAGYGKDPTYGDIIERGGKRSFKSQELYEKLIALGLDHIEANDIIEALYRLQRKIDNCPMPNKK